MFAKSSIESKLDQEIISALETLENQEATSDEYGVVVDRIAKLHKLKTEEASNQLKIAETLHKFETDTRIKPPSLDNVLVVAANLLGILWLTRYEREHVLSSKALGFVMKPR